MNSTRESFWMLLASLLFACMGVCVKLAADHYSAPEIVFYRSLISLLLMLCLVRWQGVSLATPYWRRQFFRGASGFVSLLLYFYAIAMLPLATAVTLNYTSPLFLVAYLALFGQMHLQRRMIAALAVGFIGVAFLLKPTFEESQWLGGLIGLGSGVLAGLAYFNVRILGGRGEPEARTVFYFALFSTLGAFLWMGIFGRFDFHPIDLRGGLLLLGVGGFATVAQLAMTRSYRLGNAIVSASLAYSAVIFASIFGVIFWGETLGGDSLIAMTLIIGSGMVATQISRRRPVDVINPAAQD